MVELTWDLFQIISEKSSDDDDILVEALNIVKEKANGTDYTEVDKVFSHKTKRLTRKERVRRLGRQIRGAGDQRGITAFFSVLYAEIEPNKFKIRVEIQLNVGLASCILFAKYEGSKSDSCSCYPLLHRLIPNLKGNGQPFEVKLESI